MKHSAKAKVSVVKASLRKVAAALSLRPSYPAWIDAEQGIAFPATIVSRRVRDCLVLRLVDRDPSHTLPPAPHATGAR